MDFGVLGSLYVNIDGMTATPGGPKLRQILSLLLLNFGTPVPASALMRELWRDEPPSSCVATLHTHIMHLRKSIAVGSGVSSEYVARNILITRAGGYLLRDDAGRLDLKEFRDLTATARGALRRGRRVDAVNHLLAALDLWRGPALADVTTGPLLESKVRQLEESRLTVLGDSAEAEIELGLHRQAVLRLSEAILENPLHEGLHLQYMKALHLDGRRAEALRVFHRLRSSLVAETGLEPGPPVQRLQQAILTDE